MALLVSTCEHALTSCTLINNHRRGNAPAVYETVLLAAMYAGSASMARLGFSRLHQHQSSGGVNRRMRYLFMAVILTNEIAAATACISTGVFITLLAYREAEIRIRTIIMLVRRTIY